MEHVYAMVHSGDTDDFTEKVRHSVAVIEEAVKRYRYTETITKTCPCSIHRFLKL